MTEENDDILWKNFTDKIQQLIPAKTTLNKKRLHPPEPKTKLPSKMRPKPQGKELDKRTDARLQKGRMRIDARLDLHGMTQDQAYMTLENFIGVQLEKNARNILVITGKGSARNSEGILKKRFPEWIAQSKYNNQILKYVPARPQDGGKGAFYIYLRRHRNEH